MTSEARKYTRTIFTSYVHINAPPLTKLFQFNKESKREEGGGGVEKEILEIYQRNSVTPLARCANVKRDSNFERF